MRVRVAVGKRIAAFFDLDGTLIPEPSLERRFFARLRQSGAIVLSNYIRWSVEAIRLLPSGINRILQNNKLYLHGLGFEQAIQKMEAIRFYEAGVARVAWHARQGHRIVIVSGTLEPLAKVAANALGRELKARGAEAECTVCATRLEEKARRWTGRIVGEAVHGEAKSRAIRRMAKEEELDLSRAYAYGNNLEDWQMLSAAGLGQAVNPEQELAKLAKLHDWRIWHWNQTSKTPPDEICGAERGIQKVESGT